MTMWFFILVLSLISVAHSNELDGKTLIHVPSIILDVVKKAGADCMSETGVAKEVVNSFFNINISDNGGSKKFVYCIGKKINYIYEDGRLNDSFLALYADSDLKDEAQKVFEECNVKKATKYDTAYASIDCFYKNSPVIVIP